MTIGLNSDELVAVFLQSLQKRTELIKGMIEGAQAGENPKVKEVLEKAIENMRKTYPNIPNPEFLAGISVSFQMVLFSLMDAVVANNADLEKSIPHITH